MSKAIKWIETGNAIPIQINENRERTDDEKTKIEGDMTGWEVFCEQLWLCNCNRNRHIDWNVQKLKKKHENALEFRHQLGARNKQKINEDNFYMIHKLTTASAIMIEVN